MLPKPLVAASLEPLILGLLGRGETYGYQLIKQIQALSDGRVTCPANKLYPLLHRLEQQGLVAAVWREGGRGPGRKYYRLTPAGERALARTQRDWLDVHHMLVQLWGPGLAPAS
ncbi:MAG: PadR family transcriptional regulator [Bacteroidota bacterium]